MLIGQVEGPQADDIRVRPEAAALEQELVAEHVGKRGVASALAVLEYLRLGEDVVGVPEDSAVRQVGQFPMRVEMILVPVIEEGLDRQPLQGRETCSDPQRLYGIVHGGAVTVSPGIGW